MHKPVLLNEIIEYLNPQSGEVFVDGTANGGGHTMAIAEKVSPDGKVVAIEWDKEIFTELKVKSEEGKEKSMIIAVNDSYANLKNILSELKIEKVDGILLDLGFSSVHIDVSGRGFSFQKDEPLDMRYNIGEGETAAEIVNSYSEKDLADILYKYGEERFSRQISRRITEERKKKRILTTFELVRVIESAVPIFYRKAGKINCATRTFQALRIVVNNELENLENVLPQIVEVLNQGGKVAIISFHSLEDRIVKNFFRDKSKEGFLKIITKKPIIAGEKEIENNPRSRSAKLRIAIKV